MLKNTFVFSFFFSLIVSSFLIHQKYARADWTVDTVDPLVSIQIACGASYGGSVTNGNQTCSGSSATITITCDDATSGCQSLTYSPNPNNSVILPLTYTATANTLRSATDFSVSRDAAGTISATAVDGAGNTFTRSVTLSFVTCSISLASNSILEGDTTTATATLTPAVTAAVSFTSGNTGIATVSPASDSTSPYETTVTGVNDDSVNISATVGTYTCTHTPALIVNPACTMSSLVLSSANVREESTVTATPSFTVGSLVDSVSYLVSNANAVSSVQELTSPFRTILKGENRGTTTITANAYKGNATSVRCSATSPTLTVDPGCVVNAFQASNVVKGETGTATTTLDTNTNVTGVEYGSGDATVTSIDSPGIQSGATTTWTTTVRGQEIGGPVTLTTTGKVNNRALCTANTGNIISTLAPLPWWQVKDADVLATGRLVSTIPSACTGTCIPTFNLAGTGNFSGVNTYGGEMSSFGGKTIGSPAWLTNTTYTGRKYDYDWFARLAPQDVFGAGFDGRIDGGTITGSGLGQNNGNKNGYLWRYSPGPLTIGSNANLENNKVILFVNGNLTINNNIELGNNGFFAAIVNGNITLSENVKHPSNPSLAGFYLANGTFSTGTNSTQNKSNRLIVRGAIAAWGGVNFQRNVGNDNDDTPAEYIEYAPELILNFPRELLRQGVVWKEVAP